MGWLLSVYIGAAVFGLGVTAIDLFGLLGGHDGGHDAASGHDGDANADAGFGGHDGDMHTDAGFAAHDGGPAAAESSAELSLEHDGGADHEAAEVADHDGSVAGHDRRERRNLLLGLLSVVRSIIYFCLGFGPVGWIALATGGTVATSLTWSLPVGVVALVGTRLLRRFMRRELNSEVSSSELLMERGVVTVSIGAGELGKVRVKLGDLYVERFARAASPNAQIHAGTPVRVTDVTDECVYVEEE